MTSAFFFLLLIEIISIVKLLIIVHFFVWKHEKQTLSCIHTKFEGDRNTCFFSLIYFVGAPVFLPQHWKLLGPERLMPLKLLGMNRVKPSARDNISNNFVKSQSLTVFLLWIFFFLRIITNNSSLFNQNLNKTGHALFLCGLFVFKQTKHVQIHSTF